MRRIPWLGCLLILATLLAARTRAQRVGPDAAVGTPDQRLAAAIEFDSTGTFVPGEGLTTHVRLSWTGTAAFMARRVYAQRSADELAAAVDLEAARSAFFNYTITGGRVTAGDTADLPGGLEYDVQEVMQFGVGGRPWSFYVPVPRVFRRIPVTPQGLMPPLHDPPADDAEKVAAAVPPPGRLPVGDVGRWTVRATYALAEGMFAAAPEDRHVATDFATFDSRYSVENRTVRLERTLVLRQLTINPSREAELAAFYEAVDSDRRQEFLMSPYPPGQATPADQLNEQALADIDARRFGEALPALDRATALEPRHRWAWYNLAVTELYLHEAQAAVGAATRALEADPSNPYARVALGQALDLDGRVEDAERTLREQVEKTPWSVWALHSLARFYASHNRPAESAGCWKRSLEAAPSDTAATLALSRVYLEAGKPDEAAHILRTHLEAASDPLAFNAAAFELAEREVELPLAASLIDDGLDALVARTGGRSATGERMDPHEATGYLAAMWDTAGWVAYKQGQYAHAAAWFRAAAGLSRDAEIVQHLQQASAAIDGPRVTAEHPVDAGLQGESASFHDPQAPDWKGDVQLVHDRLGQVLDVRGTGGAPVPERIVADLKTQSLPFVRPPDERDYMVERRATIACHHEHCSLAIAIDH